MNSNGNLEGYVYSLLAVAFFVAVPGYVIYHTAFLAGLVPTLLGGVSTPMMALSFLLILPPTLSYIARGELRIQSADISLYILLGFMITIASYNGIMSGFGELAQSQVLSLFQIFILYVITRQIVDKLYEFQLVAFASFLLSSIIILFGPDTASGVEYDFSLAADSINYRDYQGYALSIVVCCLFASATIKSFYLRISCYAFCQLVLFVNGARSELLIFSISVIAAELIIPEKRQLKFGMFMAVSLIAILFIEVAPMPFSGADSNRVVSFFVDPLGDASLLERAWANNLGWETVKANPVFGDYGSYPPGLYSHNALSSWVDFGLVGFLIYILVVYAPLIYSIKFRTFISPQIRLVLPLAIFMGLSIVATKAYTYKFLGVLVGAYASSVSGMTRKVRRGSTTYMVVNR